LARASSVSPFSRCGRENVAARLSSEAYRTTAQNCQTHVATTEKTCGVFALTGTAVSRDVLFLSGTVHHTRDGSLVLRRPLPTAFGITMPHTGCISDRAGDAGSLSERLCRRRCHLQLHDHCARTLYAPNECLERLTDYGVCRAPKKWHREPCATRVDCRSSMHGRSKQAIGVDL
jgi:hypothetical protein